MTMAAKSEILFTKWWQPPKIQGISMNPTNFTAFTIIYLESWVFHLLVYFAIVEKKLHENFDCMLAFSIEFTTHQTSSSRVQSNISGHFSNVWCAAMGWLPQRRNLIEIREEKKTKKIDKTVFHSLIKKDSNIALSNYAHTASNRKDNSPYVGLQCLWHFAPMGAAIFKCQYILHSVWIRIDNHRHSANVRALPLCTKTGHELLSVTNKQTSGYYRDNNHLFHENK